MKQFFSLKTSSALVGSLFFVWWTFFWNVQDNRAHKDSAYPRKHYHEDTGRIYFDLGKAAQERNDYGSALKAYKASLEHCPEMLEVYDNMGIVLEHMDRQEEAFAAYTKGMSIHPHFNQVRFMHGKSIHAHIIPHQELIATKPSWNGEDLTNKAIFIYAQNCLGDTINFARYLQPLVTRGAQVLFKPQSTLAEMFKEADPKVTVLGKDDDLTKHTIDYHCSLLSLPHVLKTTLKDMPGTQGYLKADPEKKQLFKDKLFTTPKLKVGIVWQGNPALLNDKNRSTKLPYFYDLGRIPGVQLYSIQKFFDVEALKQVPSDISIIDLDPYIKTFSDTAALISNLDLVIAIDSVVAHLTGALGVPVWMLTPYVTDWRWFGYSEDESSVWYSSMKKLRQNSACTWGPVFARAGARIKQLAPKA